MKQKSIFIILFCAFFYFNLFANTQDKMSAAIEQPSQVIYQTWEVFDETQLEKAIDPFSVEKFSEILLKEGIEIKISQEEFETVNKIDQLITDTQILDKYLICEDEFVKICMPSDPLIKHHVVIILKTSKTRLTELNEEEGLILLETIQKVGNILKNKFGFPGYVISRSNENPNICHIIPPNHKDFTLRDALEKAYRNKDTLYPNAQNMPKMKNNLTEEKITSLVHKWQVVIEEQKSEKTEIIESEIEDSSKYSWSMVTINNDFAKIYILDGLFQVLKNLGVQVQKTIHKPFAPIKDEIITKHLGCVFCKENIINYQKCFEYNEILVLYNHTSPLEGYHFMVIPKRHVKNIEGLTKDELKTIHLIEKKLIKILEEKFDHSNIRLFVQNSGPSVGQTVPHFHDKLVVTHKANDNSEALLFKLFTLQYIQGNPPKVSNEEMKKVSTEIGIALEEEFTKQAALYLPPHFSKMVS